MSAAEDDVHELLELFLAWRSVVRAAREQTLAGSLVLLHREDALLLKRAAAARIAGAAVLAVVAAEREARLAMRAGYCDFVVTDLDEALRILKNEIRTRRPISVCLQAEPAGVLRACVERGVQPELLDGAEVTLEHRGSRLIAWQAALHDGEDPVVWTAEAGSLQRLALLDALAVEAGGSAGQEGSAWLREAPPVLGRRWQRMRLLPMHAKSAEAFIEALQQLGRAEQVKGLSVARNGACVWPVG